MIILTLFMVLTFFCSMCRLGRRITIVVNLVLMALFGIGTALVPNITMFNIMRFFNAMTSAGVFQTAFVLSTHFSYLCPSRVIGYIGYFSLFYDMKVCAS